MSSERQQDGAGAPQRAGARRGQTFVGRFAELGRLAEAESDAAAGVPQVVVVCGEAGVGKTRLLSQFCATAASGRVLLGGCVELGDCELPYAPFTAALRHLPEADDWTGVRAELGPSLPALARLVPSIRDALETGDQAAGDQAAGDQAAGDQTAGDPPAGDPGGEQATELGRAQFFELMLGALGHLSRLAPVVLVLEDLHWADRSTLDLLLFLVGNLRAERLLLVVTVRTDGLPRRHHVRAVLAELTRHGAQRLELATFTRAELGALAAGMLGSEPDGLVLDRLLHRSDGNAFFAEELLAAGAVDPSGPPASLRDIVLARVDVLGPEVRALLEAAAVVGRPADEDLLGAVSGLPPDRLTVALRAAVDEGIMLPEGSAGCGAGAGHRFRHSIGQEAVYEELLPGERRRSHAAVASALAGRASAAPTDAASAAELAHHWYAAGDTAKAIGSAAHAGRLAIQISAYTEAGKQLQRALELGGRDPAAAAAAGVTRGELLELAAEASRWVGDLTTATALCRQALAAVDRAQDPARAGVLCERLGRYLWEVGDSAGSLTAYEQAVELLATRPGSAGHARAVASQASALMLTSRYRESRDRAHEAVGLARAVGAVVEESHALATLGVDLSMLGDMPGAEQALRRARTLAVQTDSMEDICRAYTNLSSILEVAGRLDEAARVALEGFDVARRKGLELTGGGILAGNAAAALFKLGRWAEVEALLRSMLPRLPGLMQAYMAQIQAALSLSRGDLDAAARQLDEATELSQQVTEPQLVGPLFALHCELAIERQDTPAAMRAVEQGTRAVIDSEDRHFVIRLCALGLRAVADEVERSRWARGAERSDDVRDRPDVAALLPLARQARDQLVADGACVADAAVDMLECEAEWSRCGRASDPALWSSTADAWQRLEQPLRTAYARLRAAEAFVERRELPAAARQLQQSYALAGQLGAGKLLADLAALAGRTRLDLAPEAPREGTHLDAADRFHLTPREREVLRHVAQGRSNRQIARALVISEKTASVHVSNILGKLGATSRTQAAALAHRLQLLSA